MGMYSLGFTVMIFVRSPKAIQQHCHDHDSDNVKINSTSSNIPAVAVDGVPLRSKLDAAISLPNDENSIHRTDDCSYNKRRIECDSPISSSQFPNVEQQYYDDQHCLHNDHDSDSFEEIDYNDLYLSPVNNIERDSIPLCFQTEDDQRKCNPDQGDNDDDMDEGLVQYRQLEGVYESVRCQHEERLEPLVNEHYGSKESTAEWPNSSSMFLSKPFFVMDFLEQVDPEDVKRAQSMLLHSKTYENRSIVQAERDAGRCIGNKNEVGSNKNIFLQLTKKLSFLMHDNTERTNRPVRTHAEESSKQVKIRTLSVVEPIRRELSPETRMSSSTNQTETNASHQVCSLKRSPSSSSCFFQRSVEIGNKYNARGIQCASIGAWSKALSYWQDALEIRTQVLGEKSIDVADTCNNIGIALGKVHRFEEALTTFHRTLLIQTEYYRSSLCRDSSEAYDDGVEVVSSKRATHLIATTYHNMGNVYQELNSYYNAIQCYRQCETIFKMIYGQDHIEVARSLVAMGHTYRQAARNETSVQWRNTSNVKAKLDDLIRSPTCSSRNVVDDCCYSYYYEDAKQAYVDALRVYEELGYIQDHAEVRSIIEDIRDLEKTIKLCL
jgi:tetratricopeptide (TPR) repeat protein